MDRAGIYTFLSMRAAERKRDSMNMVGEVKSRSGMIRDAAFFISGMPDDIAMTIVV